MEEEREGGNKDQKRILVKLYRFPGVSPSRSRHIPEAGTDIQCHLKKGPRSQKPMEPPDSPREQSYFEILKRHARPAHALSPARKRHAGRLAGCVAPLLSLLLRPTEHVYLPGGARAYCCLHGFSTVPISIACQRPVSRVSASSAMQRES